jgi:protein gp37
MAKSKIEWTDRTWNFIRAEDLETGKIGWHCEHVSEGCRNCYAERMNLWQGTGRLYRPVNRDNLRIFLDERVLLAPAAWRNALVFVCSMTDLFAGFVPDDWIDQAFAVMVQAQLGGNTFQVVTKRSARAKDYMSDPATPQRVARRMGEQMVRFQGGRGKISVPHVPKHLEPAWPPRNVWGLVSVEDQATADERVNDLIDTPWAVRGVSYEPALAAVDFRRWITVREPGLEDGDFTCSRCGERFDEDEGSHDCPPGFRSSIDWLIFGGESGQRARPAEIAWARAARDQCREGGVAFFLKQLGAFPMMDGLAPDGGTTPARGGTTGGLLDRKGGDMAEWPEDIRIREYPS